MLKRLQLLTKSRLSSEGRSHFHVHRELDGRIQFLEGCWIVDLSSELAVARGHPMFVDT
jgi:hypothetical protein